MNSYEKLLSDIPYDYLNDKQKELFDIVGNTAYSALVAEYGGEFIYIPKAETIAVEYRNRRIYELFNGENYKELAKMYNLTERYVRRIVNRMHEQGKEK
ncbi:MAG: Mor transcription activator family protein [Huintestinicola sp.]